jgi:putative two-component system response regulator
MVAPTVSKPSPPPGALGRPDRATTLTGSGIAGTGAAGTTAAERDKSLQSAKIIIIDDEECNILVARKYLNSDGYKTILPLNDSTQAIARIRAEKPDLVLLDIMMPRVGGLEILQIMQLDPALQRIPVLILTSSTDAATKKSAISLGAVDFLGKPVDPNELLPRVRNTLQHKQFQDRMSQYAEKLEQIVKERTMELVASRQQVIHCLARAAEFRDDNTGQHVVRVGRYVGVIARELGFSDNQIELLELAAQLHDIGKIGIPDDILRKPGKLDPDEYDLMQKHCMIGKKIISPLLPEEFSVLKSHTRVGANLLNVRSSPLLLLAARIAQTHHEKWDGTGYPLGLKGEDIPIEGRMTAVADVFDALSTARPYKTAYPREKCFAIMEEGRGKQFDPRVLDAFFNRADDVIRVQLEFMDQP